MRKTLPLASLALLAACTVGPEFKPAPPPATGAGYGSDGGARAALAEGPGASWWKSFGSPQLNELVGRALTHNHSLAASLATLERSRQRIAAVAGRRLPQVDSQARVEQQKVNLQAFGFDGLAGAGLAIENPEFDLYTVGGGISYDLDLFGRNRRALEQAVAESEAEQRRVEAAHLIITGRVVAQVLAIAGLNDRIATQRALLAEDERDVDLTQKRQKAGVGTLVEVLTAQSQLSEDRARLPGLEQELAEARNMLAILTGASPAELGATDFSLDRLNLPATVPVALPAALVHKRPDILEAEARLHAATAAVGVATAQLYPDITIGANMSQLAGNPGDLFKGKGNAFDIFGSLTAPIFHGGTLKAEQRGAEAEVRASAERYQDVVLEAFRQVSDLLSALDTDGRTFSAQLESARIAERNLYLSRRSFQVGNSGVLQVLDAGRSYQRARLALVEARSRQYLNVARLYVATAGGWIGTPES